jgi:MFS transporter, DHA3 family, macrolide efflux protein
MPTFILIWAGQLVSLLGSHLTGFAVGVWVYQRTRSVTLFGLAAVLAELPGLVVSPVAGALVDRWDRRRTLLLADLGGALSALVLLLLARSGHLALWHVYGLMIAASVYGAFQIPAHGAMVTVLVPARQLTRAAGMTEMSVAVSQLAAPMLGGLLLGLVRLDGVVLIDFLTFFAALTTLWIARVPPPPPSPAGLRARGTLLAEAAFGAAYVRAAPALLALLVFQALAGFLLGFIMILGAPMALHFVSPAKLGLLLSTGGLGMLAGSLLVGAWGGPRRLVRGVLWGQALCGLSAVAGGLRPSPALFGAAIFCFFFFTPLVSSCSQAIWQRKVPADVQGRVFAMRRMIGWIGVPAACLLAGPLADRVCEPLMAAGGALAPTAGRLLGVGAGRGIALLFVVTGALMVLLSAAAAFTRLRAVEGALPDAMPPQAPAAALSPLTAAP